MQRKASSMEVRSPPATFSRSGNAQSSLRRGSSGLGFCQVSTANGKRGKEVMRGRKGAIMMVDYG